jgi:hypothetical protein
VGGSQTGDYSVFKTSRSWIEEDATWANASNSQPWSKAGGDYISPAIAKVTSWPRTNGKTWVPFDVLAAVKDFVKNPASNFGFMLVNTKSTQEIDVASSENTTADQRPKLTISYTPSSAVTAKPGAEMRSRPIVARAKGGELHLYAPAAQTAVAVSVFSANGTLVLARQLASQGHEIVSGLGAGVYFITAVHAGERRHTLVSITP